MHLNHMNMTFLMRNIERLSINAVIIEASTFVCRQYTVNSPPLARQPDKHQELQALSSVITNSYSFAYSINSYWHVICFMTVDTLNFTQ